MGPWDDVWEKGLSWSHGGYECPSWFLQMDNGGLEEISGNGVYEMD